MSAFYVSFHTRLLYTSIRAIRANAGLLATMCHIMVPEGVFVVELFLTFRAHVQLVGRHGLKECEIELVKGHRRRGVRRGVGK